MLWADNICYKKWQKIVFYGGRSIGLSVMIYFYDIQYIIPKIRYYFLFFY